jgi:putative tryptophan/tyrosine transport system substrate-binding protein
VRRRTFLALTGGAAAWPLAARAQQDQKLPIVGILGTSTAGAWSQWVAAFVQRMRELGWTDGRTISLEYRWGEGRGERYSEIAAEFALLKADVIVTTGNAVAEAKQGAPNVPIVFAAANDPVSTGLVANLARPGGNVTGLSNQAVDLASKRLGLLHELLPTIRTLGIVANVGYSPTLLEINHLREVATNLNLETIVFELRRSQDIPLTFEGWRRAEALYVIGDSLTTANRIQIAAFALALRLPAMFTSREFAEAGGLISYGPNFPHLFRRAADYADKILRGTKAAELPVEQPTKFDLVVNLVTAKVLGVEIPPTLLARADEVIE